MRNGRRETPKKRSKCQVQGTIFKCSIFHHWNYDVEGKRDRGGRFQLFVRVAESREHVAEWLTISLCHPIFPWFPFPRPYFWAENQLAKYVVQYTSHVLLCFKFEFRTLTSTVHLWRMLKLNPPKLRHLQRCIVPHWMVPPHDVLVLVVDRGAGWGQRCPETLQFSSFSPHCRYFTCILVYLLVTPQDTQPVWGYTMSWPFPNLSRLGWGRPPTRARLTYSDNVCFSFLENNLR